MIADRQLRLGLFQDLRLFFFGNTSRQIELQLVVLVEHFKLEQGRLFDQILGALGLFDAGQLHDDLLQPLPLHHRFGHAELVDAVPDRFQGLVDRGILNPLDLYFTQLPHQRIRRFRRLRLGEGRIIIEHLLNLRLEFGVLELDRDLGRSRPGHRLDGNFLVHQQILKRHDRSIDGDFDRAIFVHFHDKVNSALEVQAQRNAFIRHHHLQPGGQRLIERLIGRDEKNHRHHHHQR